MDIRFYFSRFLRRAHWFLLVVLLCSAAGVIVARVLPPVFVAKALLVVESEQIPDAMAQSTVQTQASEQLQIIQQRMLARENLLDIANRLRVYDGRQAAGQEALTAGQIVADMRGRIAINTTQQGGQRGAVQATLVSVSFDAETAQMAAAVANELVTRILQEDVSMRTVVARQTLEFFQQEVERLEQVLADRSAAILAFKEQNLSALPESLEFRRQELARIEVRLADLERQRTVLFEQIDRLTRLRGGASASSDGGDAGSGRVTTRDIRSEDLNSQLSLVDDELSKLQAQAAELTTTISKTPGNAILLEALERDYASARAQYDQAVVNRAKAETGETIEALSKGQRITVIDQAVAPDQPEKPNRPKLVVASVGAGIAAGLGLVAVLEFLWGAIRRPADLVTGLGIAPIAVLPYVTTIQEKRRNRAIVFLLIVAFVGVVGLALWLVHTQVMPLDLLVDKLKARLPLWMNL
ncbi:GumC family protein [Fuscovulum ytuae]|uniref:Wzz/FepE/Etk N-terminal domain-containing protein n=1 Tax=Fuscovulum ytuae TaxID=3042299 RepID=A0ABY8Q4Z5_9RHOB|nr:Wzz/FepE/Etk N-terminal domain-containing protein [Fuscovulum sp. YMD61]WGV15943.1 Wzz/FepE/Etk N-terminal domain-containing protein [Fuscovulum sp. YMD61]